MIIDLDREKMIGRVESVDTASVIVHVLDSSLLSAVQVHHFVVIRSSRVGQYLIGMVDKIVRRYSPVDDDCGENGVISVDMVKINLIGTFMDVSGTDKNVFKRTLQSVPEIDADCFALSPGAITRFMKVISQNGAGFGQPLLIGSYTLNDTAEAYLDGNKFFQRHAVITGSTGSGKSCTVATLIEQIAGLPSADAILFDIHGEYGSIVGEGIHHYRIAGPGDVPQDHVIFLPYWLLSYEEMLALMLDRTDNNAPNQAMLFARSVMEGKRSFLNCIGEKKLSEQCTIDSPVPYGIDNLIKDLRGKDTETVTRDKGRSTHGEFYGKLSRFIQRLENKITDKRLNFMFSPDKRLLQFDYLEKLCNMLMAPAPDGGVKIIDLSEVPSDILPLVVSLIARLVLSVQQWVRRDRLHPIALFCDEAHLYIPACSGQGVEAASLSVFGRIAREGRKYGIGLIVITQRPSEVNRTVLSQANNFVAMRLSNAEDQNVIKRLLPDNMGNYAELLPILDTGEAIIVGDASLLPSRIMVKEPKHMPDSATVNFWDKWSGNADSSVEAAVKALRRQHK